MFKKILFCNVNISRINQNHMYRQSFSSESAGRTNLSYLIDFFVLQKWYWFISIMYCKKYDFLYYCSIELMVLFLYRNRHLWTMSSCAQLIKLWHFLWCEWFYLQTNASSIAYRLLHVVNILQIYLVNLVYLFSINDACYIYMVLEGSLHKDRLTKM